MAHRCNNPPGALSGMGSYPSLRSSTARRPGRAKPRLALETALKPAFNKRAHPCRQTQAKTIHRPNYEQTNIKTTKTMNISEETFQVTAEEWLFQLPLKELPAGTDEIVSRFRNCEYTKECAIALLRSFRRDLLRWHANNVTLNVLLEMEDNVSGQSGGGRNLRPKTE
jgi:hypothetical protein